MTFAYATNTVTVQPSGPHHFIVAVAWHHETDDMTAIRKQSAVQVAEGDLAVAIRRASLHFGYSDPFEAWRPTA